MSIKTLDPALERSLRAARAKRERRGASGDGRLTVPDLTPDEALALDGLLAPRRPILPGKSLSVALSTFEAALRAIGIDPFAEYRRVGDGPVRDLPAERAASRLERASFSEWLDAHPVLERHPPMNRWLRDAQLRGRIRPEQRPLVELALEVVASLPAAGSPPCQRTVLAARAARDPHALDPDRPLHTLVIALLASELDTTESDLRLSDAEICVGDPGGAAADARSSREIWAAFGVLLDPISSNVAVLNPPLEGNGVAARLCAAAQGACVILTYAQLTSGGLRWRRGVDCFCCENPSVLVAAEQSLGASCPPMICTAGRPSDAVRAMLDAVVAAGGRIHHHGDDDEAGHQIMDDLRRRYGARPWTVGGDALFQELVIDALIDDLEGSRRFASAG